MRLVIVLILCLGFVAINASVVGEAGAETNNLAQMQCALKKGMKVYGLFRKLIDAYEKFLDSSKIGRAFKATREARYNFMVTCYDELNTVLDKYLDGYKRPTTAC